MNAEIKYYIVAAEALPEVFLKVAEAKRMLQTGEADTVGEATRLAGISRSAFYKYKDAVQPFNDMKTGHVITFYAMLKDAEFREKVENAKGFCLCHFRQLLERSGESLPNSQRDWFREKIPALMQENLLRMKGDLDRFVMKNDFRNASLPWENAMDAVPRGMQKLQGGHPSDPVFRNADYGIK